jgi:hypothetical protein
MGALQCGTGSRLTAADRRRIEATIARKVPRPRAADRTEAARQRAASGGLLFCGKTAEQVATMVVSPNANICSECVEWATLAIAERKAESTR